MNRHLTLSAWATLAVTLLSTPAAMADHGTPLGTFLGVDSSLEIMRAREGEARELVRFEVEPAAIGTRFWAGNPVSSAGADSFPLNLILFAPSQPGQASDLVRAVILGLPFLNAPGAADYSALWTTFSFFPGFSTRMASVAERSDAIAALEQVTAAGGEVGITISIAVNRNLFYRHQTSGEVVVDDEYCTDARTHRYTVRLSTPEGGPAIPAALEGLEFHLEELSFSYSDTFISRWMRLTRAPLECAEWIATFDHTELVELSPSEAAAMIAALEQVIPGTVVTPGLSWSWSLWGLDWPGMPQVTCKKTSALITSVPNACVVAVPR